jgi:hypothetical protein
MHSANIKVIKAVFVILLGSFLISILNDRAGTESRPAYAIVADQSKALKLKLRDSEKGSQQNAPSNSRTDTK